MGGHPFLLLRRAAPGAGYTAAFFTSRQPGSLCFFLRVREGSEWPVQGMGCGTCGSPCVGAWSRCLQLTEARQGTHSRATSPVSSPMSVGLCLGAKDTAWVARVPDVGLGCQGSVLPPPEHYRSGFFPLAHSSSPRSSG